MTDIIERLRERGIWSDGGKVWDQDALCAAAATALEAKDKELAALRERVKELETDVWPQWASEIWEKLKEYGCQDDDDGSVDLSDQFSVWVDEYASECQARSETAERRVKEQQAFMKELSDALISVRPLGGSELFVKRFDEYFADPAYCKAAIEERSNDCHEAQKGLIRERRRAETAEQRLKSRDTCQDAAFAKLLDRKDELAKLLATAERERDRIADELDTMNNNHRVMAKLLADTARERDEAREALKPFAVVGSHLPKEWRDHETHWNDIAKLTIGDLRRAARAITGESHDNESHRGRGAGDLGS
jgi:hypothetical protein